MMQNFRLLQSLLALATLALWASVTVAEVTGPTIPKAKEMANPDTKCIKPVEDMRKNHMHYLLHQRDETLREGIREEKFKGESLKECIGCHNAPGNDGKVARVSEREHFCNACHSFAAVKIDCFDCHADKPANTEYRHPLGGAIKTSQTGFDSKQLLNQPTLDPVAAKEDKKP